MEYPATFIGSQIRSCNHEIRASLDVFLYDEGKLHDDMNQYYTFLIQFTDFPFDKHSCAINLHLEDGGKSVYLVDENTTDGIALFVSYKVEQ